MKKIVFGSDIGGIKELIRDRENGFIFKTGDIEELKNLIYSIKDNSQLSTKIGENAFKYIKKERNWFDITKIYSDIYSNLLNKN